MNENEEMSNVCSTHGGEEEYEDGIWWESHKEMYNYEGLDLEGMIILKGMLDM
jgi:hypothetical protein